MRALDNRNIVGFTGFRAAIAGHGATVCHERRRAPYAKGSRSGTPLVDALDHRERVDTIHYPPITLGLNDGGIGPSKPTEVRVSAGAL